MDKDQGSDGMSDSENESLNDELQRPEYKNQQIQNKGRPSSARSRTSSVGDEGSHGSVNNKETRPH